jgi:hypothetical protein
MDELTSLGNRSFFHRAAKRRMELYRETLCRWPAPYSMSTTSSSTTTTMGTKEGMLVSSGIMRRTSG